MKFRQTPIFFFVQCQKFVGATIRNSAEESPSIKAGQPEATPHLATACGGINTIWETKEIFSEVWEKSAAVDSAEPNSKGILLRLRRRDIFVGARLLSTGDFCGCDILSTQHFC